MIRFLLLLMVFFSSLFANNSLIIDQNKLSNKFQINYLEDKTSNLSINEIEKQNFMKTTKSNFNLGYHSGTIWFKFDITNSSQYQEFILTLNETFYETANLYYRNNKEIQKESNSLFFPIDQRDIKSNHLAFNLELQKNEIKTIYIELKAKYAYFGEIEIFEKKYYYLKQSMGINTFFTFLLGMIFVLMFFTFFLYSKTKEKIYLYYLIYNFFLFIYFTNICGLLVFINLQKYIYDLHLSSAFAIGFLILFSKEYLQTKKYLKNIDKILSFLSLLFFIFGFMILFSYQPWNKIINNFSGITCIILIIVSTIVYFKGHFQTKFYIFAIVIYFLSLVVFTFMVNGIFEYSFITRYGFTFGITIEILIFSYILANRYHLSKEETQLYLENEVAKRTKELTTLVEERELLLKEIYHRVKNNFHMIMGMLHLENNKKNEEEKDFVALTNRVKSMSLIHEYLYKSKDLLNIDIKSYFEKIISNLKSSYTKVTITSHIENVSIEFDDALSLGIIINEILTNSMKHNKIDDFLIDIKLFRENDMICMIIQDNGKGFKNNDKKGLGLKLVNQFSKKLPNGNYYFSFDSGTRFELRFEDER